MSVLNKSQKPAKIINFLITDALRKRAQKADSVHCVVAIQDMQLPNFFEYRPHNFYDHVSVIIVFNFCTREGYLTGQT